MIAELGVNLVKEGEAMEVTGLLSGYSKTLRTSIWKDKIARAVRNLRSWMKVPGLEMANHALIFRAYAMSVWAFTA